MSDIGGSPNLYRTDAPRQFPRTAKHAYKVHALFAGGTTRKPRGGSAPPTLLHPRSGIVSADLMARENPLELSASRSK